MKSLIGQRIPIHSKNSPFRAKLKVTYTKVPFATFRDIALDALYSVYRPPLSGRDKRHYERGFRAAEAEVKRTYPVRSRSERAK